MTHKYQIGQILDMLPNRGSSSRHAGQCEVLRLLPFEGSVVQYRVQSVAETCQRIVSESDLRVPGALV